MKKLISFLITLLFIINVIAQNNTLNSQKVIQRHSKSENVASNIRIKSKITNTNQNKTSVFFEGFEGATFPPTGWTKSGVDPTPSYQWKQATESYSGSHCAAVNWDENVVSQDEWLISPSINLKLYNAPLLSFWWSMSYYWGVTDNDYKVKVKLSANGGVTWKLVWTDDSVGVFSDFVYYKQFINLSAYDTCSNFKVAFEYVGVNGDNLYIDDVLIENMPNNRMEILNPLAGFVNNAPPYVYSGYSQVPLGQKFPITLGAVIKNTGKLTQNNIKLHSNEIVSGKTGVSSAYPPLSSLHSDTVITSNFDTLDVARTYLLGMYASSDSVSFAPNLDTFKVVVNSANQGVFARDNDFYIGEYLWNEVNNGSVNAFQIANLFQFTTNTYAKSISVVIAKGTTVNAPIRAILYSGWDDASKTVVAESDYHFINSNEIVTTNTLNPNKIEIYFNSACPLLKKDSTYFVTIQAFGGADTVLIAANNDTPQPENTMFLFDTDNIWYSYSSASLAPMIRLNTSAVNPNGVVEQQKNTVILYQNVPNPAINTTKITYELAKTEKVLITIYDLYGREVMKFNEGLKSIGLHSLDVNLNNLSSGTYFYTLNTSAFTKTKKMIVKK